MDPEWRSHIVLNVSLCGERQGQKEGSNPLVLFLKDPRPTARNSILVSHLGGRHRSIWVRNVHEQKDWMKSRAGVQTQATRCRTRAPNWSLTHQAKSLVLTAVKDTNRVPILAGSYLPSSSLDSPRKAKLIVPYWPTSSAYIWFASTLFFKKKKSLILAMRIGDVIQVMCASAFQKQPHTQHLKAKSLSSKLCRQLFVFLPNVSSITQVIEAGSWVDNLMENFLEEVSQPSNSPIM